LIVRTEPFKAYLGTPLVSVYERKSVEDYEKDGGERYEKGGIFTITRFSRADYEAYLCSAGDGMRMFARDDENFYCYVYGTDPWAGAYRRDGGYIDDWMSEFDELLCFGDLVVDDMIARNGMTEFDSWEFIHGDFSYGGMHLYIMHHYVNSRDDYVLALSQPAKQGEGGIWCVERVYSTASNYWDLYFPWESGLAGAEYYSRIQDKAGAVEYSFMLDPILVSIRFIEEDSYIGAENPTADMFRIIDESPILRVSKLYYQVFEDMGSFRAVSMEPGSADLPEVIVPDRDKEGFAGRIGRELWQNLWVSVAAPPTLSGNAVFVYNADRTKVLGFYQQDNYLYVNVDGTPRWLVTAYTNEKVAPYDFVYSFYDEFYSQT